MKVPENGLAITTPDADNPDTTLLNSIMKLTRVIPSALLACSASFLPVTAQATETPDEVIATVQLPPIPELASKLLEVARAIKPGPETEMQAMMVLAPFGYPAFPGISAQEHPTVVFLKPEMDGGEPAVVILAKLTADAPLRQNLVNMGIPSKDIDGWILISPNPMSLERVSEVESLVALSRRPQAQDITATLFIGPDRAEQWFAAMAQEMDAEGETEAQAKELMRGIGQRVGNLSEVSYGLNLSSETLGFALGAVALADTPEADFFNGGHSGNIVEVAKLLPADRPLIMQAYFDMLATQEYLEGLLQQFRPLLTEEQQRVADDYLTTLETYSAKLDNTSALTLDYRGMNADISAVYGGSLTYDEAFAYLKSTSVDLLEEIAALMPSNEMVDFSKMFDGLSVEETDLTVAGHPVFSLKVDLSGMMPEEAEMPEGFETRQEYFYTVIEGKLLSAANTESLTALALAATGQESVSRSVADVLGPLNGASITYQVDIIRYLDGIFSGMPAETTDEQFVEVLNQLKAAQLPPLRGKVTAGDNAMTASADLPLRVIAELVRIYEENSKAAQAAEQPQL